ncbi:MAG: cbb3-type cytochrome oxidase subunit 3 [Burkholderiales bacterium]
MNFDLNLARSIVTVAAFVTFVGIVIWAWSGARRERFEAAARLPLEDDEPERAGRGTALSDHGSMK